MGTNLLGLHSLHATDGDQLVWSPFPYIICYYKLIQVTRGYYSFRLYSLDFSFADNQFLRFSVYSVSTVTTVTTVTTLTTSTIVG